MNTEIYKNKTSRQKRPSPEGFTLVEVLMAMLILLFGLLAVASMQVMSMRGNQHARETTDRTTTADNIMEWLIGLDFNHDNLTTGTTYKLVVKESGGYDWDPAAPSGSPEQPQDSLVPPANRARNRITDIEWTVTAISGLSAKKIDVTIKWEGGGSTSLSNVKNQI